MKSTYTTVPAWGAGKKFDSISELLEEWEFDYEDFEIKVKYGDKYTINFYFSTAEQPLCCGIREMGSLSNAVLNNKDMDIVFKKLFKDIQNRTLVINTISTQKQWEKYLNKTELFSKTKVFINPGTKNKITMWTSTN